MENKTKKVGRPKIESQKILEAMKPYLIAGESESKALQESGVCRETYYKRKKEDIDFLTEIDIYKEETGNIAESNMARGVRLEQRRLDLEKPTNLEHTKFYLSKKVKGYKSEGFNITNINAQQNNSVGEEILLQRSRDIRDKLRKEFENKEIDHELDAE